MPLQETRRTQRDNKHPAAPAVVTTSSAGERTAGGGGGSGTRVGAYLCACQPGLYLPTTLRRQNTSITHLNGSFLEKLYYFVSKKRHNAARKDKASAETASVDSDYDNEDEDDLEDLSAYEYLLQPSGSKDICLPCAAVCEGTVWCTSYTPCSMVGDLAFRLPLVLLTMVTMIGAGCLLILTFKFRNDKVRHPFRYLSITRPWDLEGRGFQLGNLHKTCRLGSCQGSQFSAKENPTKYPGE